MTVSDQKGLITRAKKTNIGAAQPSGDYLFPVCITPQNTGCLYMQCDKTSSILNFCLFGCWGGGEQGWGMWGGEVVVVWGTVGSWQWPDGGTSDTASASPLHDCVPARQHAAICWTPPPPPPPPRHHHHHPNPPPPHTHTHADAAITTDNATS